VIDATKHSVNTVYAQLIKTVGAAKVVDLAHKAGISAELSADLSLTLGTSEVSVLDMASAYSTFARRGEHVAPVTILEVQTADGHVLERSRVTRTRAFSTKVADTVNYCLQQVVSGGTGTGASLGKPVAGKTGTTQDFGDAWFVGYTPRLTTAVWMGFPEGNSKKMTSVRGRQVNGGSFPATIFKRFMTAALGDGDYGGSFAPAPSLGGKPIPPVTGAVLPTTTTSSSSTSSTVPPKPGPSTTLPPATTTTTGKKPTTTTSSSTSSSTTSTTRKP
jgi:membrane peptidoglycan carboxypeptidase